MFFPISGADISPIYLVLVGFVIGIMGGFFGVGGSFIAGPALRLVGLDWNFAVGTDLAHIVGKSVVAVRQHRAFGNVDLKLGLIMAIGTIAGAEVGAQLIQIFKRAGNVNVVVSVVSIVVYLSISAFMLWESRKTLIAQKKRLPEGKVKGVKSKEDHSAFGPVTRAIQRLKIWPMVSLPASGIKEISLWLILLVAVVGGFFSGFLGGGAGYIRMPSMVYVLGIPTHLAVGTDLFEIIISASYGTFHTRSERQCGHLDRAGHAHRRGHWRTDRRVRNAIFRRPENPTRFCPLAADRRSHRHLHSFCRT